MENIFPIFFYIIFIPKFLPWDFVFLSLWVILAVLFCFICICYQSTSLLTRTALGFSTATACWGAVGTQVIVHPDFTCHFTCLFFPPKRLWPTVDILKLLLHLWLSDHCVSTGFLLLNASQSHIFSKPNLYLSMFLPSVPSKKYLFISLSTQTDASCFISLVLLCLGATGN